MNESKEILDNLLINPRFYNDVDYTVVYKKKNDTATTSYAETGINNSKIIIDGYTFNEKILTVLVERNRVAEAIKYVQETAGVAQKEAKDIVNNFTNKLAERKSSLDQNTDKPSQSHIVTKESENQNNSNRPKKGSHFIQEKNLP